jgi:hypothetical protein
MFIILLYIYLHSLYKMCMGSDFMLLLVPISHSEQYIVLQEDHFRDRSCQMYSMWILMRTSLTWNKSGLEL